MPNAIDKAGPVAPHRRQSWIHRFAIAAFMADDGLLWDAATQAAETHWTDFGSLQPGHVVGMLSTSVLVKLKSGADTFAHAYTEDVVNYLGHNIEVAVGMESERGSCTAKFRIDDGQDASVSLPLRCTAPRARMLAIGAAMQAIESLPTTAVWQRKRSLAVKRQDVMTDLTSRVIGATPPIPLCGRCQLS